MRTTVQVNSICGCVGAAQFLFRSRSSHGLQRLLNLLLQPSMVILALALDPGAFMIQTAYQVWERKLRGCHH